MKIVIIGGSFGGVTAARAARQKYPASQVTLIEKNTQIGFIPGALHLVLNGEVEDLSQAVFVTEDVLRAEGIEVLLACEVTAINLEGQEVSYVTEVTNQKKSYDKLILSTGSVQDSSQIKGIQSERILKYKTRELAEKALDLVKESQSLAIVGAGQIGIEMADCLIKHGKEVTLIESMDGILSKYFDAEMMAPVLTTMRERGVTCHFNETVEEISEEDGQLYLRTQEGQIISDSGVFALSVKPQLAYLAEGIQRHQDNTILVDDYLQTTAANVFAIGDCIQMPSSLAAESFYLSLTNNAIRTALVAVENLTKPTTKFIGSARTIGTKVFDHYIGSTGMTESESIFFDEEIAVSYVSQPATLFNSELVHSKLVYSQQTGRVLGGQIVAKVNVLEKVNTLALGIQMGITLEQLRQKDYFFHPSLTPVYDLTNQLGYLKD
ncbi:FAD-dependent oxidoreductase [Vagococcus salmoninarum]|uniref:FAD-dependent oxidoreductase n=1 Tax=Vagococcus salmoninarum TaxID=2739 RepID=UPI003F99529C